MQLRPLNSAVLALALAFAAPAFAAAPKAPAKPKPKPAAAAPAAPQALKAAAGSTLKITGDSTLHKWDALGGDLEITAELASGAGTLAQRVAAGALGKLRLRAGAASFKSNEGSSMDKNMHKALEAPKFPDITFAMDSYKAAGEEVTASGTLSIHGVAKPVDLKGRLGFREGAVTVQGSYALLMSDYGIKPPVMMLGTVKVSDKVVIVYDFALEPRP
jgi:polyisoprenoid-binding protein YceI